tara:strand:+ start:364 stop:480 length:117 start_codon:yes stop_codon:yes gene_type:complete
MGGRAGQNNGKKNNKTIVKPLFSGWGASLCKQTHKRKK